jgi:hypothetical protein
MATSSFFFPQDLSIFLIKISQKALVGFATPFLSRQVAKICPKKKTTGSKVSAYFWDGSKKRVTA